MNRKKLNFLLFSLIFTSSSFAATSFFAKSLMRTLFDIEVSPEEIKIQEGASFEKLSKGQEKSFNLLVWNIYKGDLFQKSPLPVNYNDFQIILFQEYAEGIAKDYLPQNNLYFLPTFKWEGDLTGVAIYAQEKLKGISPLHTKYREPFILTPKASLITEYRGITVINTHALNFVSEEEWLFELNEISKFLAGKEKIIWAGDFNTWSSERTQYLLNHMDKLGLKEVKFTEDHRTLHLGFPVDFIFTKGISYQGQKTYEAGDYSDHNPLSLTITP